MSINRVNISGNLTRDPELKTTGSGTAVLNFGVAVNDRVRDQVTGEWGDRPNFVDCVVFGARAEALNRFLSKGAKVAIEGKLRYRQWETADGQKRSKLEVVVDEVEFLSPRNQGGGSYGDAPRYGAPAQQASGFGGAAPAGNFGAPAPAAAPVTYGSGSPAAAQQQPAATTPPSVDVYDEDIPF